MSNQKVVVTGASGYIAGILIKDLLLKGYQVVGIVRDKKNTSKLEHLLKLDGASERLVFEEGDIDNADYATIFKGATYIVHTASPVFFSSENPQKDIVDPAIKGNVRVLEAAALIPSIKKVVITSSIVAVFDPSNSKKAVITEDDWNDTSSIASPYPYSKYLSEKKAHEWVREYRENHKDKTLFEVVFINPAFVFGAPLSKNINVSIQIFAAAISGNPLNMTGVFTHVQDVSDTITYVLESNENFDLQRKLLADHVLSFKEIAARVAQLYPHLEFVSKPDLTLDTESATKTKQVFKSISPIKIPREPTGVDEILKSTVDYLIANKHVTPIPKK